MPRANLHQISEWGLQTSQPCFQPSFPFHSDSLSCEGSTPLLGFLNWDTVTCEWLHPTGTYTSYSLETTMYWYPSPSLSATHMQTDMPNKEINQHIFRKLFHTFSPLLKMPILPPPSSLSSDARFLFHWDDGDSQKRLTWLYLPMSLPRLPSCYHKWTICAPL